MKQVTIRSNGSRYDGRTGTILSTDEWGTAEIRFDDGDINYFDSYEIKAA